jgi:predicted kinase
MNTMGQEGEALMDSRHGKSGHGWVFARDIGAGNDEISPSAKPVAHIVVGFIGSGKTTFARKLEKETGAVRFTKDEWMVRLFGNTPPKDTFEEYDNKMASLATDMALKCLKAGMDVVIDEGFWVREHRDAIRDKVRNVGAIPKVYFLKVPLEVMKTRTLRRSEKPPIDSYVIDEETFNHYWKFFQPPESDEEFALIEEVLESSDRDRPVDNSQ